MKVSHKFLNIFQFVLKQARLELSELNKWNKILNIFLKHAEAGTLTKTYLLEHNCLLYNKRKYFLTCPKHVSINIFVSPQTIKIKQKN